MAKWDQISRETFEAAKLLQRAGEQSGVSDEGCFRSSVSRYYYSAFSAAIAVLGGKITFPRDWEGPHHQDVPKLLGQHFAGAPAHRLRQLKAAFHRLYKERLAADYRSGWTVDRQNAVRARKDAYFIGLYLEVLP